MQDRWIFDHVLVFTSSQINSLESLNNGDSIEGFFFQIMFASGNVYGILSWLLIHEEGPT